MLTTTRTRRFLHARTLVNLKSTCDKELQFSAKEVCRSMATPTSLGWKALKRVDRFLSGRLRLVYVCRKQTVDAIDIYIDTD